MLSKDILKSASMVELQGRQDPVFFLLIFLSNNQTSIFIMVSTCPEMSLLLLSPMQS
jgi:hypothetical protein